MAAVLLVGLFVVKGQAQGVNNVIPKSPEVSEIMKYSEIPVSKTTGVPSIEIPLYTVIEHGLKLPINMSYHASTFDEGEVAPRTGLGWSLSFEGAVIREMRGIPDENTSNGFIAIQDKYDIGDFYTTAILSESERAARATRYYDIVGNCAEDLEPDLFTVSLPAFGLNAKFAYGWDGQIHVQSKEAIKVESLGTEYVADGIERVDFIGFIITDALGYRYTFSAKERDITQFKYEGLDAYWTIACEARKRRAVHTWKLTKIESPDQNHWINFEYTDDEFSRYLTVVKANTYTISKYTGEAVFQPKSLPDEDWVRTKTKKLSKITTSSGATEINFIESYSLRQDISEKRLQVIRVSVNGNFLKQFRLNHNYETGRLTLKSVTEQGSDFSDLPPYKFAYYGTPATSVQTDYTKSNMYRLVAPSGGPLGNHIHFNAAPSATDVLNGDVYNYLTFDYFGEYPGANYLNTLPNPDKLVTAGSLKHGILDSIYWPSGRTTAFEYEPHDWLYEGSDKIRKPIYPTAPTIILSAPLGTVSLGQTATVTQDFEITDEVETNSAKLELGVFWRVALNANGSVQPKVEIIRKSDGVVVGSIVSVPYEGCETNGEISTTIWHSKLTPGNYMMRVSAKRIQNQCGDNPDPSLYSTVGATFSFSYKPNFVDITSPRQGIGVRVKKIVENDGDANSANNLIRRFEYKMNEGGNWISSGIASPYRETGMYNWKAVFNNCDELDENGYSIDFTSLTIYNTNTLHYSFTDGSLINYEVVTEFLDDAGKIGKIESHYTSVRDYSDQNIPLRTPFVPAISNAHKRGLLTEELVYKNHTCISCPPGYQYLVQKDTFMYHFVTPDLNEVQGLRVKVWSNRPQQEFAPGTTLGCNCDGTDNDCIPDPSPRWTEADLYYEMFPIKYTYFNGYTRLVNKCSRQYGTDRYSTDYMETCESYNYDESRKQLILSSSIDSRGIERKNKYLYLQDYQNKDLPIDPLVEGAIELRHMPSLVLEEISYKKYPDQSLELTGGTRTEMGLFNSNNGTNYLLPKKVYATEMTEATPTSDVVYAAHALYKLEEEYHSYDLNGNLISHAAVGDEKTVYQWDKTKLLAFADNCEEGQFHYINFEDGSYNNTDPNKKVRSGEQAYQGSSFTFAASPPNDGNIYLMSYWYYDGTKWNYVKDVPFNTTISHSGAEWIDDICWYKEGLKVTTFGYDKLNRLIHITRFDGQHDAYEYDGHGRLITTRDIKGNIKQYIEYYLKGL